MKELKYDYTQEANRLKKDVSLLSFEEKKAFRARKRRELRANSIEALNENLERVAREKASLEARLKNAKKTNEKSEEKK